MLSVIIVSWNTRELLRRCLLSIEAQKGDFETEIIVVDNASHDDTPAMLRAEFPGARLIETGANLGFSAGNNVGLRAASGKWLLLLNPDTEIVRDSFQRLIATLEGDPFAGVVGPCVRYADGTVQVTRHRLPMLWTLATASTPLAQLFAPLLNRFYYQSDHAARPVFTGWLTGAAILLGREVYERVGGFDERFFMYYEETDWQRRIKAAGWTILYDPYATIIHHEARASAQVGGKRDLIHNQSRVRYAAKWHGRAAARLLCAWLIILFAVEWAKEGSKWLVGHKRTLRRERLTSYRRLLASLAHNLSTWY